MIATDNLKTLAKRYGRHVAELRDMATDLGLAVDYSSARRTWFLNEDATTVRVFNEDLANFDFTA